LRFNRGDALRWLLLARCVSEGGGSSWLLDGSSSRRPRGSGASYGSSARRCPTGRWAASCRRWRRSRRSPPGS
jgi:hypothetical protein